MNQDWNQIAEFILMSDVMNQLNRDPRIRDSMANKKRDTITQFTQDDEEENSSTNPV